MRRAKTQPIRNKLDLSDHTQVRLVSKRLRVSEAHLTEIADRIGNSMAAISKEVAAQRDRRVPAPTPPPAAVMTTVTTTEQTDTEFTTTEQTP